ncbi:MAG: CaiB/BaiF CoA transferase family protein [Sphingomonas sp.]
MQGQETGVDDDAGADAAPLAGITVIEIGHSIAAPFAGSILSQLGASVFKVEHPNGGDPARGWGPPFAGQTAIAFEAYNHGKASIAADLKDQTQRAALRRYILDHADVVIQNLKPGSIESLGLDAETLRASKPDLIYANISAFGTFGPLRGKPGYDPLMQAYAGLMSITGDDPQSPVRIGVSVVDMGAGMWSVIGILCALLTRARTKRGGAIDTSLYETALAWMSLPLAIHLASGEPPKRFGSGVGQIVPYQAFATSDGHLMVAAGTDSLFRRLAEALGHPEWAEDERFRANRDRVVNRDAIVALVEARTALSSSRDLAAELDRAGVPNAPLRDAAAVIADEQTQASGMIRAVSEELRLVGLPISIDGERPSPVRPAPSLGVDTARMRKEGPPDGR